MLIDEHDDRQTDQPRFQDLEIAAALKGYAVHDVPADGNCMFHAISKQVSHFGTTVTAAELCSNVVEYLDRNRSHYERFVCTHAANKQDTEQRDIVDNFIENMQITMHI